MKIGVILIILILIASFSLAAEVTETGPQQSDQETAAKITALQQDIKSVQAQVNKLPTEDEIDSSFAQLDSKINSTNQSNVLNYLAFLVGVIIFNDIIVAGLYIIMKNRGMLP